MTGHPTGQGHMSALVALNHLLCTELNAEMLLTDLLIDGDGESGDGGWDHQIIQRVIIDLAPYGGIRVGNWL